MNDREMILQRIRDSLATNRAMLEREAAKAGGGYPEGPFLASTLTPVQQFAAELEALHGHVHHCSSPDEARAMLRSLLASHEVTRALHWDPAELPLDGVDTILDELAIRTAGGDILGVADRAARLLALEPVPICISGADAAIAESGSIVVMSGRGRPRLASLLPPIHIALLPQECIVRTLPEAFDLLRQRWGPEVVQRRSNVTVITGPSRSADIEQSLTLGVHGPKEVHAIIWQR